MLATFAVFYAQDLHWVDQERFDSPIRAWANLLDIHAKGKLKRRGRSDRQRANVINVFRVSRSEVKALCRECPNIP